MLCNLSAKIKVFKYLTLRAVAHCMKPNQSYLTGARCPLPNTLQMPVAVAIMAVSGVTFVRDMFIGKLCTPSYKSFHMSFPPMSPKVATFFDLGLWGGAKGSVELQ